MYYLLELYYLKSIKITFRDDNFNVSVNIVIIFILDKCVRYGARENGL